MFFPLLTIGLRIGNVPWAALPIGVMILGALHLNFAVVKQRYKITDNLGQETSFPMIGGNVEIFCNEDDGSKVPLINLTAHSLKEKVYKMKNNKFRLDAGYIETAYVCEGIGLSSFTIGMLHCNPFNLIPKVSCTEQQWCLIGKDGQAKCKNKDQKDCFLASFANMNDYFETSFPTHRAACTHRTKSGVNKNTVYGYCHAMSENKTVFVLSNDHYECHKFGNFTLNSILLKHQTVNLVKYSSKKWDLKYLGKGEVNCSLKDMKVMKSNPFNFTGHLSFDPKVDPKMLPKKSNLACLITISDSEQFSFSTYLIVFDPDISKYDVSLSKKLEPGKLVLACSCKVPEGFVCGLTWEEPKINDDLQDKPEGPGEKTLLRKHHAKPIVYTCYMRVLAYDYPLTFKLRQVPLGIKYKAANVTVDAKDFDEGSGGDSGNQGNNGAGKDKTGNGKDGKEKNSNENKSNEDSSSKAGIIAAAILIPLLVICVAVGVGVFIFMRKRKKAERTSVLETANAPLKQSEVPTQKMAGKSSATNQVNSTKK